MFRSNSKQFECASARSAAAFSSCTDLSVILDAALLASFLFALAVLDLHILVVLVVLVALVSILRINLHDVYQPESLA